MKHLFIFVCFVSGVVIPVAKTPQLQVYWASAAGAIALTAVTAGVAILLSGHYKQSR